MKDFLILKKFCDDYREFGNAHMVDFIHGDFTARFLNSGKLGDGFKNSVEACKKMMSKKLVKIEDLKEEMNSQNQILSPDSPKVKDMPDKKSYEISQLSHLIADVCQTTGTNHVIDVGAGKGYLSTFLSAEFGLEVTAIDCVKNNLEKTLERAKSLEKHFHHRSNQADEKMEKKSTEVKIECVGDVVRPDCLPGIIAGRKSVLVGLHCCGDLSSVLCHLAEINEEIVGLVLVPCCYHHLSEKSELEKNNAIDRYSTGIARGLEKEEIANSKIEKSEICEEFIGFPMSELFKKEELVLGQNARMLACHSEDRVQSDSSLKSVFFRALLKKFLVEFFPKYALDKDGKDVRVGKIFAKVAKKKDLEEKKLFAEYVKLAAKKLKIDEIKEEILESAENMHEDFMNSGKYENLRKFEDLRNIYAKIAEYLILSDKISFLQESEKWRKSAGIQIFDPKMSPRAYCLVAYK